MQLFGLGFKHMDGMSLISKVYSIANTQMHTQIFTIYHIVNIQSIIQVYDIAKTQMNAHSNL